MVHNHSRLRIACLFIALMSGEIPGEKVARGDETDPILSAPVAEETVVAAKEVEGKVTGQLTINQRSYKLADVIVYEALHFEELKIHVLACSEDISPEVLENLNKALKKNGTDDGMFLFEPHVKLIFDAEGKLDCCQASAENHGVGLQGVEDLEGTIKNEGGRISGMDKLKRDPDDGFSSCAFDLAFEGTLIKAPPIEAKPKVTIKQARTGVSSLLTLIGLGGDRASRNVYALPMPEDATKVHFNPTAEQISFRSESHWEDLAESMGEALDESGWEYGDDVGMFICDCAIIKRISEGAKLTIVVFSQGEGSNVVMMAEGMTWEEKGKAAPSQVGNGGSVVEEVKDSEKK